MSNMSVFLHPLLFSVLIAASPYAQYAGFVPPSQFVPPFLSVCALAAAFYLLIKTTVKTADRVVAVLSPLLMTSFYTGALYEFVSGIVTGALSKGLVLVLGTSLFLFALFAYIRKVLRSSEVAVKNVNNLFCVIAASMLLVNAYSIFAQYRAVARASGISDKAGIAQHKKTGPHPDIYFIILDEYASGSQLKEYFNYDLSPFTEHLQKKGFMVTELKTKSVSTNVIIESRMNMFVANSTEAATEHSSLSESVMESVNLREYRSEKQMFGIRNSKVVSWLKNAGYQFINIGSWFSYTRYNRHADENINTYGFQVSNEIAAVVINSSILRLLLISRYFHRTAVLDAFAVLADIPVTPGKPKFIFTHIICPHAPYVFGADGERIGLFPSGTRKTTQQLYLDQHIFITKKVKEFVDRKLASSEIAPVIIIQADHGARMDRPGATSVFSAIYLPSHRGGQLRRSTPSANTFRYVFNEVLRADLELLK